MLHGHDQFLHGVVSQASGMPSFMPTWAVSRYLGNKALPIALGSGLEVNCGAGGESLPRRYLCIPAATGARKTRFAEMIKNGQLQQTIGKHNAANTCATICPTQLLQIYQKSLHTQRVPQ